MSLKKYKISLKDKYKEITNKQLQAELDKLKVVKKKSKK